MQQVNRVKRAAILGILLFLLAVATTVAADSGEIQVSGNDNSHWDHPAVAVDADGDRVVVWQAKPGGYKSDPDILARRYDSSGTPQGDLFVVNSSTDSWALQNPAVAMDDARNFVVVWEGASAGDHWTEIYARRFDSSGAPIGAEFRVNLELAERQRNPAVAMDDAGNFVVVWESTLADGFWPDVYAQRFDNSGTKIGSEFRVNSDPYNRQEIPDVAMDSAGNFVVVWQDYSTYPSRTISAQLYDSNGNVVASQFQVNSSAGNAEQPAVAMNGDGDFVVTWRLHNSRGDIALQRFDSSGTPIGGEFLTHAPLARWNVHPDVAVDGAGNFMIAWLASLGEDYCIYGQYFHSDGTLHGPVFRINERLARQTLSYLPAVALDDTGRSMTVWLDREPATFGYGPEIGIFARLLDGPPLGNSAPTTVLAPTEDPSSITYWKREYLIYESRLLETLPDGFEAPRVFLVEEREGVCWLWLEDVGDMTVPKWTQEDFGIVALHLGLFNGVWLAGRDTP